MHTLFSGCAYPGHGPVIEDGKTRILEYISHRQQRENQVLEILNSSAGSASITGREDELTAMEIVKLIYKDVPEVLHASAEHGILQILWKLREEKVKHDVASELWSIKGKPLQ